MTTPPERPAQVEAEVRDLLAGAVWDTIDGAYLQGELVDILLAPRPAEQSDTFRLVITVQATAENTASLDGLTVALRPQGRAAPVRLGRLDHRGQALFLRLDAGAYRASLGPRLASSERLASASRPLLMRRPPLMVRQSFAVMPAAATAVAAERYQLGESPLTAQVITHEVRPPELLFDVRDRAWDGRLVAFVYRAAEGAAELQLRFAPLAWSAAFRACMARLDLPPLTALDLGLLDGAVEMGELDAHLPALAESVRMAQPPTRAAWRRLLEQDGLSAEARAAIAEVLA